MAEENNQASEEVKVEEEKKEEVKVEEKVEEKKEEVKEAVKEEAKVEEEEEEKEVEVPEKFKKMVKEVEEMSVLDLSELVKILEKKFGVSAMAPMAVAGVAPAGEAPAEEKSVFNIELTAIGDKKIEVIKAVRDITEKGLKEAKDIVDAAMTSPQMVKENVKKDDAEEIKKKLETAGAKVELK